MLVPECAYLRVMDCDKEIRRALVSSAHPWLSAQCVAVVETDMDEFKEASGHSHCIAHSAQYNTAFSLIFL